MNRQQRDLYEATLESLTTHPEEWTGNSYRITHRGTGVSVWLANYHYGLAIEVAGTPVLGGVTYASSFFGPLISWRRKLRAAALSVVPDGSGSLTTAAARLRMGAA